MESLPDIILLEDLQDALVVGIIYIRIGDLVPAGAQSGGGGVEQILQLSRILLGHVQEPVVEYALDAVLRSVNISDGLTVQSGADDAVRAGVDNGSGAAGLTDNACAF